MNSFVGTWPNREPLFALAAVCFVAAFAADHLGQGSLVSDILVASMGLGFWMTCGFAVLVGPVEMKDIPTDPGKIPSVWSRLRRTVLLLVVVLVFSVATGVLFIATQDPQTLSILRPLLLGPAPYLAISGVMFAVMTIPVLAWINRRYPNPIKRCMSGVVDIALVFPVAALASLNVLLLTHLTFGRAGLAVPAAMAMLFAIVVWRIGPYWKPVLITLLNPRSS